MPYRRLPNTDLARIRALEAALNQGQKLEEAEKEDKLAYPFPLIQRISTFLPKFESAMTLSRLAREQQCGNSPKCSSFTKKARLYISHFIQVLNFCIARGELKPSARTYYGLDEKDSKVPPLLTEQDLLHWGKKIIDGEQSRLSNGGGNPIYCPSIALVKVNYDNFRDNYLRQKQFQTNSARESGHVADYRKDADQLILEIWNSVEAHFEDINDEEERREKCSEYGLVYVFRRGEKERIRRKKEAERITLKLF